METGFTLREDLYDALGISAPTRPVARVLLYLRQSPTGYGPRHILNLEEVLHAVRSTGVPFTYVGYYYQQCLRRDRQPQAPAFCLLPMCILVCIHHALLGTPSVGSVTLVAMGFCYDLHLFLPPACRKCTHQTSGSKQRCSPATGSSSSPTALGKPTLCTSRARVLASVFSRTLLVDGRVTVLRSPWSL
jgi:hypothetical protein